MKRFVVASTLSLALVIGTAAIAAAFIKLPVAGTATQVKNLVAASTSINNLPLNLNPTLLQVPYDSVDNTYLHPPKNGCGLATSKCVFGKTTSKHLVVLFGDSHAWMWLAAVAPEMSKLGIKLELFWIPGCPPADLTLYGALHPGHYETGCDTWRATTIATIKKLNPALVVLAERTSDLYTGPSSSSLVTTSQLATALEKTITELKTAHTKVAVIGDNPGYSFGTPQYPYGSPTACLAVNPTKVQKCSTPVNNPDPKWASLTAGEKTAATTSGATYINTVPWFCVGTNCSPIVGKMAVYFDWSHVTATYSAYLSGVMGSALKPLA